MNGDQMLKLGLIGDNIAASSSPTLHRLAGAQAGLNVSYERLVPQVQGLPFDALLADCASGGYRGVNVTYPYKERAAALAEIGDPLVRAMGAVNTVVFDRGRARGFNTDYSGFMAAYRAVMASPPSGPVLLIGTGGVGRAVAFDREPAAGRFEEPLAPPPKWWRTAGYRRRLPRACVGRARG